MSKHTLNFGSETITYELDRRDRKSLGITVHPDRSVVVTAPLLASKEKIEAKLRKRAPWILKQQSYFLSFEPRTPPRRYVGGETHLYLGKQYRLRFVESDAETVKLMRGYFEIHTQDRTRAETFLWQWYRERAQNRFPTYAAPFIDRFRTHGVEPTDLIIQRMDKRWGSCTPRGKIILNTELIKAPPGCIEYVIVHELCHLVHHNHSRAFFDLQERMFPDWMKWKGALERILV